MSLRDWFVVDILKYYCLILSGEEDKLNYRTDDVEILINFREVNVFFLEYLRGVVTFYSESLYHGCSIILDITLPSQAKSPHSQNMEML